MSWTHRLSRLRLCRNEFNVLVRQPPLRLFRRRLALASARGRGPHTLVQLTLSPSTMRKIQILK